MSPHAISATADLLSDAYLLHYPAKAGKNLTQMSPQQAAELLAQHQPSLAASIMRHMPAGASAPLLGYWSPDFINDLCRQLELNVLVSILSHLEDTRLEQVMKHLEESDSGLFQEVREMMSYPSDSAGALMDTRVQMFIENLKVEDALHQLKMRKPARISTLFTRDEAGRVTGQIELSDLVLADNKARLHSLMRPIRISVTALDPKEEVVEMFEHQRLQALPVVDINNQVIGVIRNEDILQDTKEELTSDMASMVGASKDEKALSSSWFAVQKRMPWLQINLLTAFLAAGVVGAFEDLIAQFTALAILLPVAAGQSGNAGAQALAVTMRGLTLREITTRHWWRVFRKESAVGFMNGIAVAVTCSLGVWWWSDSVGLALVMTLAMVSSLTIACGAGALVPMALKKFGLDPAQSSSIVLTTITDIAGFMSFLGIALLLSGMLPAS